MRSQSAALTQYHPLQPTFEKGLDSYCESHTAVSDLFNGGVQFYEFYMDDTKIDRMFVFPDGCLHLVICCHKEHPSANICGNLFRGRPGTFIRSNCDFFVIRFLPGYAEFFFKQPIGQFSELEVPVQDIMPHADEMLARITEAADLAGRIRAFETFYQKYYRDALEIPLLVKYVTDRIISTHGKLHVNELYQDTGYSSRYMLKTFEKYVGMPPKLFSRIIRFQHVIRTLERQPYEHILQQIFELGYFDQNHFIKEFKEFSFLTPKKYIQHMPSAPNSLNLHV